jgi:hypothetical protein
MWQRVYKVEYQTIKTTCIFFIDETAKNWICILLRFQTECSINCMLLPILSLHFGVSTITRFWIQLIVCNAIQQMNLPGLYCNHIQKVSCILHRLLNIVIIMLMLSPLIRSKVITLSGCAQIFFAKQWAYRNL